MKEKLKNKKVIYTIIGIISVALVAIAITYAYWLVTKSQKGENVISSACLDISMNGENDIYLEDQAPLIDSEGLKLVPYTFTITNNCDSEVVYNINLETVSNENETVYANAIKISLEDNYPILLSSLKTVDPTIEGAFISYNLGYDTLSHKNDANTHSIRIWIDEKAPISEMNKVFESKISVTTGQIKLHNNELALAKKGLQIGEYVNYTYDKVEEGYSVNKAHSGYSTSDQTILDTEETLKWRIMGISNDGNIMLVSDKPATSNQFTLAGAAGYNNGVFLLNDACETLYSNESLGIKARSINIEDIEQNFSKLGLYTRDNYINTSPNNRYGEIKEYINNIYPNIFALEKNHGIGDEFRKTGIEQSDKYYNSVEELSIAFDENGVEVDNAYKTALDAEGNNLTIKRMQTYYAISTVAEYFINQDFYNILFQESSSYWVASRCVHGGNSNANFSMHRVYNNHITGLGLFATKPLVMEGSDYIRPVIELPNNIAIDKTVGNGGEDTPYGLVVQ